MAETSTLFNKQSSTVHHPVLSTYREYMLKNITVLYGRAYDYYVGLQGKPYSFAQIRFLTCHSKAVFARNLSSGAVRVLAQSCHLRFCPICSRQRENMIRRNVSAWLEKKSFPKLLTLTLKNCSIDLRHEIDRLYACFRFLRRINLVKKQVKSGIWFFQITRSKDGRTWHPHLHCILTGGYIPRRKLSAAWEDLTGDSMVVDIRLIRDVKSAACEVARYAATACNIKSLNLEEMAELDESLHHRRICGTWGLARKLKLTTPQKYDSSDWKIIGSWSAVTGSLNSCDAAREIYSAWEKGSPLAADITIDYMDDFAKDLSPPKDIEIEQKQENAEMF